MFLSISLSHSQSLNISGSLTTKLHVKTKKLAIFHINSNFNFNVLKTVKSKD